MTAEVAVLNKIGVALAADSAVTVTVGNSQKIYASSNKLFALSRTQPMGVMIYGHAELLGVPWETVIKLYRSALRDRSFPTVEGYRDDFIQFIEKSRQVATPEAQAEHVRVRCVRLFQRVVFKLQSALEAKLQSSPGSGVSTNDAILELGHVAATLLADIRDTPRLDGAATGFEQRLLKEHGPGIRIVLSSTFAKFPLTRAHVTALTQLAAVSLAHRGHGNGDSGVVFAGFGTSGLFPAIEELEVHGVVLGKMQAHRVSGLHVSRDSNAFIRPFAQRDMVDSFMQGIDPLLRDHAQATISKLFDYLPAAMVAAIQFGTKKQRSALSSQLTSKLEPMVKALFQNWRDYRKSVHIDPVMTAVSVLPKDELGAMAETLVSLTSFKRRVSTEAETVGGPIDVAIITRGEGFVWIKNKHYFKPELNPTFLARVSKELT